MKLIRDKVPQQISDNGQEAVTSTATPEQYSLLLRAKLQEEVEKFVITDSIDKLADVFEVVHRLAEDMGVSPTELNMHRLLQRRNNGGYSRMLVLHEIRDKE